jgi:hypothetical protein
MVVGVGEDGAAIYVSQEELQTGLAPSKPSRAELRKIWDTIRDKGVTPRRAAVLHAH